VLQKQISRNVRFIEAEGKIERIGKEEGRRGKEEGGKGRKGVEGKDRKRGGEGSRE
jgi:hypothetical protein